MLKEGLVLGARSMPGNPYDGHTLPEALDLATILDGTAIEMAVADRGYRGVEVPGRAFCDQANAGASPKA